MPAAAGSRAPPTETASPSKAARSTGPPGLYHFRARWYNPETGRWLSKDPIGISGALNQYAAFGNSPVNFIDPYGLCSTKEKIGKELKNLGTAVVVMSGLVIVLGSQIGSPHMVLGGFAGVFVGGGIAAVGEFLH